MYGVPVHSVVGLIADMGRHSSMSRTIEVAATTG